MLLAVVVLLLIQAREEAHQRQTIMQSSHISPQQGYIAAAGNYPQQPPTNSYVPQILPNHINNIQQEGGYAAHPAN